MTHHRTTVSRREASQSTWQLTKRERRVLKRLIQRQDIIIKPADEGSGTAVMGMDWYENKCLRQLNCTPFYEKMDNDNSQLIHECDNSTKWLMTSQQSTSKKTLLNQGAFTSFQKHTNKVILVVLLSLATAIPQSTFLSSSIIISTH